MKWLKRIINWTVLACWLIPAVLWALGGEWLVAGLFFQMAMLWQSWKWLLLDD